MNIHNEFSANSQGYDRVAENLNYVSIEDLADLEDPRLFIKELSWLKLNERILEEARDPYHRILERVKFLAICRSKLDEFFMVHVSALRQQAQRKASKVPRAQWLLDHRGSWHDP